MRPTRVEIDVNKLENNIDIIKGQLSPGTEIMAVVKANAYGHGIVEVSRRALSFGALSLGVAIPEEGAQLRGAGIECDILILGGVDPSQLDLVLDYDLSLCLFSVDMARRVNKIGTKMGKKVKVHVKIDSGMGRIGLRDKDKVLKLCDAISEMDYLFLEGIFTHFSSADEPDGGYTLDQLTNFKGIVHVVKRAYGSPKWIHAANTASIFSYPQAHFNIVRAGIGLYGYLPQHGIGDTMGIEPILSWHTKVVHVKQVEEGTSISYGRTYTAKGPRIVATLPVGYGDGYSRLLSNRGWVLIKGRRAPIIGNICMDQMMVDVTNIPGVEIGEDVVLIGQQGEESILADELAGLCGTISYEVLTNIGSRVPRIYIDGSGDVYGGQE